MPALIPECIRTDRDGEVVLSHPRSGAAVKLMAWEARILPFIGAGDAKAIARVAAEQGVKMPPEHVRALLLRLRDEKLLVDEPEPEPIEYAPPPASVGPGEDLEALRRDAGERNLKA